VVDIGSGCGFDCIVAARHTGEHGSVIGVDMTREMLGKASANRDSMGLDNVDFRFGYAEELPVDDAWADVVTSNGVINLCPDKDRVFKEAFRVLRPGGRLMLADIVTHKPVPPDAKEDIDLWTA
jgi:ubiquinone/menaquinone biosynthesis C-methylase UbiE